MASSPQPHPVCARWALSDAAVYAVHLHEALSSRARRSATFSCPAGVAAAALTAIADFRSWASGSALQESPGAATRIPALSRSVGIPVKTFIAPLLVRLVGSKPWLSEPYIRRVQRVCRDH